MKNLILIYTFAALIFGCAAQSNVPTNAKALLISKSWIIDGVENYKHKIVFTDTKMIVYSNNLKIGEDDYYLSNYLGQCSSNGFIQSNVGYSNVGKYLISKKFCLELIIVSSTKLKFKNLKQDFNVSATPE